MASPISNASAACPLCSGTGWRSSETGDAVEPCECRTQTRLERALAAARIPPRYQACAFTNFELYPPRGGPRNESLWKALGVVDQYLADYPLVDGKGLLLMGETGVGKTHLTVALVKGLVEKGAEVLFLDYQELLKRIQSSYNPKALTAEREVMRPVLETEVVVIDDLGANRVSDWVEDTINYLLNHRYNEKKPTLLTANLKEEPVSGVPGKRRTYATFEERLGLRVTSRLQEMCRLVDIVAEDYRKLAR